MNRPADLLQKTQDGESIPGESFLAFNQLFNNTQMFFSGLSRSPTDFFMSYLISTQYFQNVESGRLLTMSPFDSLDAYLKIFDVNAQLMDRGMSSALDAIQSYEKEQLSAFWPALCRSLFAMDGRELKEFSDRQAEIMNAVVNAYPQAILDIEPEYGFHFETGQHELAAETDRFYLYRITPSDQNTVIREDAKPIIILPPYVLGANILGFLPGENKSYAHCYANQGFPTYIRILKNIQTTEPLQRMTGEDDARDTRLFCETIFKRHTKPVTLNGYCQGGFNALCNLLSGELDELVDAFITCVAPMDGTRSLGLAEFLKSLPKRFNDLAYGTKTLPNGNQVADGRLMGWVYKLKSIEHEQPLTAFYRDILMFARSKAGAPFKIGKTAAALNYWLNNERNDLPIEITKISFASYNNPIQDDGTLPVQLFGRKLNLKRIQEKRIPWLICYGTHDDLVEKSTALAPLDFIHAEVTPFPKGHVAMATSWSDPASACALHTRFGDGNWRGPVCFHIDLNNALDAATSAKPPKSRKSSKSHAADPEKELES